MSKIMHARLRLAIAALISVAMLLVLANSPLQNTAIALLVAMGQDFFWVWVSSQCHVRRWLKGTDMGITQILVFLFCMCGSLLGYLGGLHIRKREENEEKQGEKSPFLERLYSSGILWMPVYLIVIVLIISLFSPQRFTSAFANANVWVSGLLCTVAVICIQFIAFLLH